MYGTLIAWRAYATARGNTTPALATDANATAALVRASDYIRTRYVLQFIAEFDGTEPEVEEATYIAAAFELTTPGFWATTFTPSQTKVLTKVGSIQWTPVTIGAVGVGSDAMLPTSPAIDALLRPYSRYGLPAVMVV